MTPQRVLDLSRQALNSLPIGVAVVDGTGQVEALNPAWRGDSYLEVDAAAVRAVLEGARADYGREYSHDGRCYELRAQPLEGFAGTLLLTQREVEERRTQFWCWESESILSHIGEALSQCFWLASPNSELLYVSPGYEGLTGLQRARAYSADERLQIVHEDDRERVISARPTLASGHYDLEYRIVLPDGEVRWLHSRGFPVRDNQGRLVRVAGVMEDVTQRHLPPAPPTVRVGIAEDEPAIRSLVARVLRRRGFDARELDLEDFEEIDVLITDVFLPGMTGVDLAARLTERYPDLKVIYMSGYTPEALAALGLAPTPLLLKPFSPDDLMEALRRALDRYI